MIRPLAAHVVLLAAVAWTAIAAVRQMPHAGYSLDEEITFAVVPAISERGLPVLPSGLLYLRGLPYSYAAWFAGVAFGQTPATYRCVSLAFALAAVVLLFRLGEQLAGSTGGVVAAVLLASFPPFLAVAGFARSYALFVAVFTLTVWLFFRAHTRRMSFAWFVAGVAACRLCHEFGLALLLLPVTVAAVRNAGAAERIRLVRVVMAAAVVAAAVELSLHGAVQASLTRLFEPLSRAPAFRPVRLPPMPPHYVFSVATPVSVSGIVVAPIAIVAMVLMRRIGASVMSAICATLAGLFQLGAIVVVVCVATLMRPRRTLQYATIGLVFFTASALLWTLHTFVRTDAQQAWSVVASLAAPMLQYPTSAIRYGAERWPFTAAAVLAGVVSLVHRERRGDAVDSLRAVAVFAAAIVVGVAMVSQNLQPRFFVLGLPVFLVVAAAGMQEAARSIGPALVALTIGIAAAQIAYAGEPALRTIPFGARVASDATLVCSEELACRHLFGRADYLLLLDDVDLANYTGRRDGERRGLYANAPVVSTAAEMERVLQSNERAGGVEVVVFRTGKTEDIPVLDMLSAIEQRYGGRSYSTVDMTIVSFEAMASRFASAPSMTSR